MKERDEALSLFCRFTLNTTTAERGKDFITLLHFPLFVLPSSLHLLTHFRRLLPWLTSVVLSFAPPLPFNSSSWLRTSPPPLRTCHPLLYTQNKTHTHMQCDYALFLTSPQMPTVSRMSFLQQDSCRMQLLTATLLFPGAKSSSAISTHPRERTAKHWNTQKDMTLLHIQYSTQRRITTSCPLTSRFLFWAPIRLNFFTQL